ncbi:replicative DNA helicase [Vulcanibacillus modesticaldus]|uniref:Replicative DNA helicase n=1 Tax=Vulcanibacillus modesticaldus TaxID=337097 RepID=A0A1D2YVL4_9BACI|nr:replicative DNA helicase [Vulcanibacillus modesticaldus]OEF99666.1 replicative DNA helicase [Vulcanibacillus modesticaldus]
MSELYLDRIPPQNIESEQAVLGAILLERDALITVMEILSPDDFYRTAHQKIYRAMLDVFETGEPVDLVTITAELQGKKLLEEVGGVSYLTDLANAVPTAANVEYYARIIEEKAIQRRLIKVATEIASTGYSGVEDVSDLIGDAERKILELSQRKIDNGFINIKEVLMETVDQIEYLHHHRGEITGIPSGFTDLDRMTSGFQKSDLIIIAARPSVGKTAFSLNVAQNVACRSKHPVAIFSLEMSARQLVQRMIAAEGNIDSHKLRTGMLEESDWNKLTMAMSTLSEAPIYIDDTPGITIYDIRARARRLKAEKGLGLILIDYLQLIHGRGKSDNRQQEISEISRQLKGIARELDVPVIALSQLSRAVEQRQDKRPMLSDIRESGSIEQDADVVAFLYRDDYYNPETEKQNIIEIIIAKQRNGPVGKVELVFLKNFNKFVNYAKDQNQLDEVSDG